ncbi:MAG: hypothetical protein ACMXYD_03530 [Candidatus Woesearchaeota archaeon]
MDVTASNGLYAHKHNLETHVSILNRKSADSQVNIPAFSLGIPFYEFAIDALTSALVHTSSEEVIAEYISQLNDCVAAQKGLSELDERYLLSCRETIISDLHKKIN